MDHAFDPIPDMDRVLDRYHLGRKPYLLKFGELRWLTEAFELGKFRIASASYYDSDEHNHARRDTELQRFVRTHPRWLAEPSRVPSDKWSSVSSHTDYYLFSLSERYSSRLFGDFSASSCLVVFDPRSFLSRLKRSVSRSLPGWQVQVSRVNYYDPIRIIPEKIVVPTYKPFRHAYQEELRLLCIPPIPTFDLAPFSIEIGPLDDCATLVDLTTHPPPVLPHDPRDDPVQRFGTTQEDPHMLNHLPDAAKVQGIVLDKSATRHEDWYFQVQYTDATERWHEIRIPMLDSLYLLNLLRAAEEEQHLGIWNRS